LTFPSPPFPRFDRGRYSFSKQGATTHGTFAIVPPLWTPCGHQSLPPEAHFTSPPQLFFPTSHPSRFHITVFFFYFINPLLLACHFLSTLVPTPPPSSRFFPPTDLPNTQCPLPVVLFFSLRGFTRIFFAVPDFKQFVLRPSFCSILFFSRFIPNPRRHWSSLYLGSCSPETSPFLFGFASLCVLPRLVDGSEFCARNCVLIASNGPRPFP